MWLNLGAVIAHLAAAMLPLNVCRHGAKPSCAALNIFEPQGMNVLLALIWSLRPQDRR